MRKIDRFKKKLTTFQFDHCRIHIAWKYTYSIFISAFSALLFSFGFCSFVTTPNISANFVTGGLSGISQAIVLFCQIIGLTQLPFYSLQSIIYFILNVPLLIFAFIKLSNKFAICTAINVGLSSLFITLLSSTSFIQSIQSNSFIIDSPLTRALFAGICTGVSSSIAFKFDVSCGGVDIISYYLGMKKSSGVGKFGIILNVFVLILYFVLSIIYNPKDFNTAFILICFSIVYIFVAGLTIDHINLRNKKVRIEIVTSRNDLSDILIALFPHSATTTHSQGAYQKKDKTTIVMVVSNNESNKVAKVAQTVDEHAFIMVLPINKVFGNFFTRPIE